MDDLDRIVSLLDDARSPDEIFGPAEGAKARYRELAKATHPDAHNGARAEAHAAFERIAAAWEVAQASLRDGSYGTDRMPLAKPITVRTRRGAYTLTRRLNRGDVVDVYAAQDETGAGRSFRVVRKPRNNDLVAREATALKRIAEQGDPRYAPYFPVLYDSCGYREPRGVVRRANVTAALNGFYSLREVAHAYPSGVHPKDAAWMIRRLLVALGAAHRAGVTHGAAVPSAVLIHPSLHGLVIEDWFYSSVERAPLVAVPEAYRAWYPDEIEATAGTDLYVTGATITHLLGGDPLSGTCPDGVPRPMRAFLRSLRLPVKQRPDDAWEVKENFDELIERMWGPRKFRPFSMPTI